MFELVFYRDFIIRFKGIYLIIFICLFEVKIVFVFSFSVDELVNMLLLKLSDEIYVDDFLIIVVRDIDYFVNGEIDIL